MSIAINIKQIFKDSNDDKPNQLLNVRFEQKIQKYGRVAKQNGFVLVPAIFSYAGKMHKGIKRLIFEQIRLKLQLVDGEVKPIKCLLNHETLRWSNFCSNQQISKQKLAPQIYQNGRFGTPYPTKLFLFLEDLLQNFELQIMNQDIVHI